MSLSRISPTLVTFCHANFTNYRFFAEFFRVMEKIRKGMVLPKANDVNGATEGLLRLQDAYDVDIKEVIPQ